MATIFATRPGYAVILPDNVDRTLTITIGGWGGFEATKSIVTELSIERQGNFQFIHSLKDLIYVYSFGERIGTVRVAGLAMANTCGEGSAGAAGSSSSGIEHVLDYYENYRLGSAAAPGPITILIGSSGGAGHFRGFLTAMKADIVKPEAGIAQFGFQFHSLPKGS